MKKGIVLVLLISTYSLCAQKITTTRGSEKFSSGSHEAVSTIIMEADIDHVIKEWKKELKDFKHDKVKDDDNEVFGDNLLVKDWGANTVDMYTKFTENKKDKTIKMSTAVDLGGVYLGDGDNKDKFKLLEKMTKEFAVKMSKEPVEENLKLAAKAFDKLEGEQKDLEREKKKLEDEIADYKKKIEKNESDLKSNADKQSSKKKEIEESKVAKDLLSKKLDSIN